MGREGQRYCWLISLTKRWTQCFNFLGGCRWRCHPMVASRVRTTRRGCDESPLSWWTTWPAPSMTLTLSAFAKFPKDQEPTTMTFPIGDSPIHRTVVFPPSTITVPMSLFSHTPKQTKRYRAALAPLVPYSSWICSFTPQRMERWTKTLQLCSFRVLSIHSWFVVVVKFILPVIPRALWKAWYGG